MSGVTPSNAPPFSTPRLAAGEDLPLAGITVLAAEQYGAGPFASMYLADMGATVIKIEPPPRPDGGGGDNSRASGPFFLGENDSHFFQTFNRNKQSLTLNLKSARGQDILHRLVAKADAVMNNMRGDQPAALGLTYAQLAPANPAIVCGHLSGYGRDGPRASWPAYDFLAQAEAGFMDVTGEPGSAPQRMGLSIVDYLSGITMAFALSAALIGALKTGRGRDIDVTLYDVAMHQLTYPATWYLNEGYEIGRRPRSGHPSVVPCETVPTGDGHLFIMCVLPKFWVGLCEGIGRPELADDSRFSGFEARYENRDALMEILDEAFSKHPTAHWMGVFAGKVPVAPVLTLAQALDNPYFVARGGIQPVDHPVRLGLKMIASPIRLDGAIAPGRAGPALGGQTDKILGGLGFDQSDIAALRDEGVV